MEASGYLLRDGKLLACDQISLARFVERKELGLF